MVRCAESWSIFWSETEKLEIFTFLVGQLLPLCTSFDCTAVLMQQRFDNLGFCTKIYKMVSLQIGEAIFYFFSSSLVLFASSDSCKKICVRKHIFKMWRLDYIMGLDSRVYLQATSTAVTFSSTFSFSFSSSLIARRRKVLDNIYWNA